MLNKSFQYLLQLMENVFFPEFSIVCMSLIDHYLQFLDFFLKEFILTVRILNCEFQIK